MSTSTGSIKSYTTSTYNSQRPRRFAPLSADATNKHNAPRLKGIIFDVDGTLCLPQNYMFAEMRAALGIPKSIDILDHIRSLPTTPDTSEDSNPENPTSPQSRAQQIIRDIESRAMTSQRPQPGLQELMRYLTSQSVPKALCTRNFPLPVQHLLDTYLPHEHFAPIITRETVGIAPKPSPEGIWAIAMAWAAAETTKTAAVLPDEGIEPPLLSPHDDAVEDKKDTISSSTKPSSTQPASTTHPLPTSSSTMETSTSHAPPHESDPLLNARRLLGAPLIMVGDSIDDMAAGHRAGAATVLLVNDENEKLLQHEYVDLGVRRLDELVRLLERGFEGRTGSE